MEKILDIFSTRELAFLTWIFLVLAAMTVRAGFRKSIMRILKTLFTRPIFPIKLLMFLYVLGIVFILWNIRFWNTSLLKDTIFWFFSFAIITFFNINKAEDHSFFRSLLRDCLKWTILIEFLVNFYTFSLTTELVMFPIVFFTGLIQAYSQTDKKHEPVTKIFTNIIALIGTVYFIYALYKTIVDYNSLFTTHNLFSLLLPVILSLAFLPFLYGLAVYMKYETLFIRVRYLTNDKDRNSKLKKAIIRTAKLNLSKLKIIEKGLNKFDFYNSKNIDEYVRHLVQ